MHRQISPITEILVREIREIKELVIEVQEKLANVDLEKELKDKRK